MKFWRDKPYPLFLCSLLPLLIPASFAKCYGNEFLESLGVQDWLQAFEAIDKRINSGWGYAFHLDTIGYLSWRESRILESYLNIYEMTGDTKWMEKFIAQADLVLVHRDDFLRGGSPTWSNLKYLKKGWRQPEPLLVNNAMIVYPLARFAGIVLKTDLLQPYQNVALWYVDKVVETVSYFQKWYVSDGLKGYYIIQSEEFANYPGINAPHNWNAQMGRVLLALYDATGEEKYLRQAEEIARTFKAELQLMEDGSYCWRYWFGKGYEKYKSTEDISHGAFDVRFAVECYKYGIVFDHKDMERFALTLKKNLWNGQDFTASVCGDGKVDPKIADTGILWVTLGKYDRDVLELVREYIAHRDFRDLPEFKWNWYMLAISELLMIERVSHESS